MNVISRRMLREFWERHADARGPLQAWFAEAAKASWHTTRDIRALYPSASFVKDRVVFNIHGNAYRLIVGIRYATRQSNGTIFIKFIGTHAEYDAIPDVGEL